jgi:hypothetical protein
MVDLDIDIMRDQPGVTVHAHPDDDLLGLTLHQDCLRLMFTGSRAELAHPGQDIQAALATP